MEALEVSLRVVLGNDSTTVSNNAPTSLVAVLSFCNACMTDSNGVSCFRSIYPVLYLNRSSENNDIDFLASDKFELGTEFFDGILMTSR